MHEANVDTPDAYLGATGTIAISSFENLEDSVVWVNKSLLKSKVHGGRGLFNKCRGTSMAIKVRWLSDIRWIELLPSCKPRQAVRES